MQVLNPNSLLQMLQNGNPRQVAEQLIQTNFPNNPVAHHLLQMGIRNDVQGIEQFARDYFGRQGKNLDTEMSNFLSALGQSSANK